MGRTYFPRPGSVYENSSPLLKALWAAEVAEAKKAQAVRLAHKKILRPHWFSTHNPSIHHGHWILWTQFLKNEILIHMACEEVEWFESLGFQARDLALIISEPGSAASDHYGIEPAFVKVVAKSSLTWLPPELGPLYETPPDEDNSLFTFTFLKKANGLSYLPGFSQTRIQHHPNGTPNGFYRIR